MRSTLDVSAPWEAWVCSRAAMAASWLPFFVGDEAEEREHQLFDIFGDVALAADGGDGKDRVYLGFSSN
ncbi:MAG: hypothetical protein IPL49_08075 [Saprospirales bacterium]|nr:hypothetical protein [Saprospirales bacterium]